MLRRASAFIMPTEAEKAVRANDKKVAAEVTEAKKQLKLAERREKICKEAKKTVPHDAGKSPELNGAASPRLSMQRTESTGETPFKGAKRTNPLNEKKEREKEQEKLQIAAISDAYGVNMSDAKVMLAKNPTLKRPTMRRNHTSEGELSFGSSSSVTTMSPPSSPLARMPSYTADSAGPTSAPVKPITIAKSPDMTAPPLQAMPQSPTRSTSSRPAREGESPETSPKIMTHSPILRASRPRLAHLPTQMSTLSIDTTMVRPMNRGTHSSSSTPTRSTFAPQSPLRHALDSPRSTYTGPSMYTPASQYEEFGSPRSGRGTPADERNYLAGYMTPRLTTVGRFHGREASYFNTHKDDDTASISEAEIYDMAARV